MTAANHREVLVIVLTLLFAWGTAAPGDANEQPGAVKTVGRNGDTLSVRNGQGDTIRLTIPAGALTEEVEISMCPLSTPASNAIAAHVFPGVELLPDGLSLLVPAKLELVPATAVADPCMVVLYHVRSADYVVPLDPEPASEEQEDAEDGQGDDDADGQEAEDAGDEIAGYIDHFSTYGGGEPTLSEAEVLAELAYAMIPPYDPYGYQAFEETLSDILNVVEMIAMLGGENPFPNNLEEAVLAHLKDFLAEPQPEPPCDPDYLQAVVAYFRIMNLFGLPVYDDALRNDEVAAVRSQMENLFKEVADRCLSQLNLHINIDVLWGENIEKNYRGMVNLGWQTHGDDPSYVYGTGELPVTGGGQYGITTTTFDGVWYVVAEGSVVVVEDEAGVVTDLVVEVTLRGEVMEEVVSCNPMGCASATSTYHYETPLRLSLKNTSMPTVTVESFEGGVAITTTTLEQVAAPLAQ